MRPLASKIIETEITRSQFAARAAAIDAAHRSHEAACRNADFFYSDVHQNKISAVEGIVSRFFTVNNGIYRNHRANRGRPFTAIKVQDPKFPMVSWRRKQEEFVDPLTALGVEIVFSTQSNSYLFRIR